MTSEEISNLLKRKGLKQTSVRKSCIEYFSNASGPVDALSLIDKLNVNKTTIYRELTTLVEEHIISEIDFGDGKKRYELSSLSHHHHLVCIKCKSVSEYTVKTDLSKEEAQIKKEYSFTVQKHMLEFFGICKDCVT